MQKKNTKPVFRAIQDDIIAAIKSNELLPGASILSENALAKQYRVCRTTVRKALDKLVEADFIFRKPGKGAFVKDTNMVTSEKANETTSIGFVIDPVNLHSGTWYYSRFVEGMQKACSRKSMRLTLISDDDLDTVDSSFLDGIVFMRNFEAVPKLMGKDIPIVLVNRFSDDENIAYFTVDYRKESRQGIEYLISLGHEKIAVITDAEDREVGHWRLNGYLDAMNKHGLPVNDNLILRVAQSPNRYIEIKKFIKNTDATALFLVNASFVEQTCTALLETGIDVPGDLSIICFDDVESAIMYPGPPLSSITMPLYEMGEKAVEYLSNKITNERFPVTRQLVNAELIIRQSTSKP